jgi:ABC-type multidrug transport system ATPase subunit
VRILSTLLRPTAGRATVLGHDVVAAPLAVRRRIGLAGQFAAVDEELTGRENLEMVGRLYRLSAAEARAAGRRVSTYSAACAAGLTSARAWSAGRR